MVITVMPWVVTGDGGTLVIVGNGVEVTTGPASVKLVAFERVVGRASVVLATGQSHLNVNRK